MEIIKKVNICYGGSGSLYGRVSLPSSYAGKVIFMRVASANEIKRLGITKPGHPNFDKEGYERMKKRGDELDQHLIELRKLRHKQGRITSPAKILWRLRYKK